MHMDYCMLLTRWYEKKIHNSMAESSWMDNVESYCKNLLMTDCRGLKDRAISFSGECIVPKVIGSRCMVGQAPPPSSPHLHPVVPLALQPGPQLIPAHAEQWSEYSLDHHRQKDHHHRIPPPNPGL